MTVVAMRQLAAGVSRLERVADWWAPEGDGWKLSELEVCRALALTGTFEVRRYRKLVDFGCLRFGC